MPANTEFERLVDMHYASLYRFALSLTRHEAEASDLTQETFWIWADKGSQIGDPSRTKSWLFTTLHREFLQKVRKQVRFTECDLDSAEHELPSVTVAPAEGLDGETVLACLASIDPAFQAPVALFYLEDCSYKEISEILEIPLGTVKSRIARGIAQLQDKLLTASGAATHQRE